MSILPTKDGSNTYVSPIYEEAFHSRHGAISESKHVFIQKGMLEMFPKVEGKLRIFEMGLGSGLNLLLSALATIEYENPPLIQYDALEKHPLPWEEAKDMDFCRNLAYGSKCQELYKNIHKSDWAQSFELLPGFFAQKLKADLLTAELKAKHYHLIYYDAFAPNAQPELWSRHICDKLYSILLDGGMLTTYCAQGQFKRNLRDSGFEVEAIPGPPGKREMTRAYKR